ncbi:MAG: class IV adenylate cyclase [Vicinamibacteraceae bacterium]|nr:class IV adenylate cyclase [Vicinamibacteraceae bacterium]
MATNDIEREVKLAFPSLDAARQAVATLGATPLRGRRLQDDALLDSADGALRARGSVLRVRDEAGQNHLTYKGPVQPGVVKVREELETVIGDAETTLRILGTLGFSPWFRYQKYREELALEDVVIAIDETPIGVFVELEGSEHGIQGVAARLGRAQADFILDSYRTLFAAWKARTGAALEHMVFEDA